MSKTKKIILILSSILIMIAIYIFCGKYVSLSLTMVTGSEVEFPGWNPTTEEFVTVSDTSILKVSYYLSYIDSNCFFYNHSIRGGGTLGTCWHHTGTATTDPDQNLEIHSIFTSQYNEDKGYFEITSIASDVDSGDTRVTTKAYGNSWVAELIANMQKSANSYYIRENLITCYKKGFVVKASEISGYGSLGDSLNESSYKNAASTEEINAYATFHALQKSTHNVTPVENNVEIVKNNTDGVSTDYTVIGPFSILYDGKDIKNIVVNGTTYVPGTATNKNYIYIYQGTNGASSTVSDYVSNADKFKTFNSTKDIQSGAYFYLAVPTSILPSDGTYTVTINQNEFDYALSRVTITSGSQRQEYGVYDTYDSTEYKINASVSWTVKVNRNVSLIIYKYDANVAKALGTDDVTELEKYNALLSGGGFKLYAVCSDGTTGWVSGTANGTKSYGSYANATEYEASASTDENGNWIKNLKKGEYFIYETKAVNGDYQLLNQGNNIGKPYYTSAEMRNIPGGSDIEDSEDEYAYIGSRECTESGKFGFKHTQYEDGGMQIIKCDATTKKELEGAEFKIYVVSNNKDNTSGWLSGSAEGTKTLVSSVNDATSYVTDSDGLINLINLRYGTYYIYEVKAPNGYNLEDQPGYHDNDGETDNGSGDFGANDGWAYIGWGTINQDTPEDDPLIISEDGPLPNYEAPSIYISKYDEISGDTLQGAEFTIYAELPDGTSAWLTGTDDDKSYTVTKAAEATSYLAYTEITNLRFGTYYIYETVAPTTDTNYVLADQEGYLQETDSSGNALPGASSLKSDGEEWAYKGSITLTTNDAGQPVEVKIDNRPEGSLQIGGGDGEGGDNHDEAEKVNAYTREDLTTTEYGTYFKIYAVFETVGVEGISSGWVTGVADDGNLKTYGDLSNATQYKAGEVISRLRYGTYYIYETQAPSDNYDLRDQDNYHVTSDEDGVAKGYEDFADDEEWVYIGQVTINFELVSAGVEHGAEYKAGYTKSAAYKTETVENKSKALLDIEKVDEEYTELTLDGAKFVIYANLISDYIDNGWVIGDEDGVKTYTTDVSDATEYVTDENGLVNLEKLNFGTYYIYEIQTPEGYDITKQEGYLDNSAGEWTDSLSGDWAYLGSIYIPEGTTEKGIASGEIIPFDYQGTNIKKVNELEGLVWLDVPDNKGNKGNDLYNEQNDSESGSADQQDELLKGIEVRLYLQDEKGNYYQAAKTYTEEDGTYKFSFDPDADNYCGIEVTYWQLVTAYVEFVYDNTTYVAVDPFVLGSYTKNDYISINSKAQEAEMVSEELEDENLTGTTGDYPGLAVTYQGGTLGDKSVSALEAILSNTETVVSREVTTAYLETTPLTGYYEKDSSDANHYKISNINLGLLEKIEPTYTVNESLAYAYLTINGYTYTYYYSSNSTPDDETVEYVEDTNTLTADVAKQTDSSTYKSTDTVSVYASDIESTLAGASNMKLYLVYGIDITNNMESQTTDDLYYEQKLYITSLTDQYDTRRMVLSDDNAGNSQYTGSNQFGLWSTTTTTYDVNDVTYGEVTYAINDNNSNYSAGIDPGETRTTYVQFQVTETALSKLIDEPSTIRSWNEKRASQAYASGFHEYMRTDNLWKDTETASGRWYEGHREDQYTEANGNDKYYIHKSVTIDENSEAFYVYLELREEIDHARTVTATVYEDESEFETDDDGNIVYDDDGNAVETGVGNGIIDETEENRAEGVTVTLLSADTDENGNIETKVADLYQVEITTNDSGIVTNVEVVYATDENGEIIYDDDGNPTYPKAITETDKNGEFTFEGVIPGLYYVEYTYGDGTQTIVNSNGEVVDYLTSNDYRSTIINTAENGASDTIKTALELEDGEVLNYSVILEKYYNDDIELENGETISYEEALERYLNGELDGATAERLEELQESLVMLEWYKYLNSTDYNTGVDDTSEDSERTLMSSYTYTSQGVYDEDGNLIAEYDVETDENGNIIDTKTGIKLKGTVTTEDGTETTFPLNVTAQSPITSISIENDANKSVEITYDEKGLLETTNYHSTFEGFNFGIIKQNTDVDVEKVITKATIVLQQGSTVYSGNPATESSTYASSLESVAVKNGITGSKYVRVELDEDLIYGSAIEVEYTVTLTNDTAEAYDSVYWYTYGEQDPNGDTETTITVNEVVDLLDEKFVVTDLLNMKDEDGVVYGELEQVLIDSDGSPVTIEEDKQESVEINTDSYYKEVSKYYEKYTETELYFSGFYAMKSGQSVQVSYSVSGQVNSSDDTAYTNQVELTSLSYSVNANKALNSDFLWPWSGAGHASDGTTIVLTPATGGDMSNTYWVVGAIALLVVAGGVVLLKKKVLK